MHYIQRKILNKLLYAESLPYSAMRPSDVESNHYAYHLDQLIKAGIVLKKDSGYALGAVGLQLIDRLSQDTMTDRLQPHIVTAIDITNDHGETLLFKRNFQPYIHRLGFPLGKLHYEESLLQAATRELKEKTGLQHISLTQRGLLYVEAIQDGTTISKIVCHVFQGHVEASAKVMPENAMRGECLWMDHTVLSASDVMPGFFAIKKLLDNSDKLFIDEVQEQLND